MKYPTYFGIRGLLSLFLLLTFFSSGLQARIGESRSALERRLMGSGGILYRDDEIEKIRMRGMPYLEFLPYLSNSVELKIYFKTSDGSKPQSKELESKHSPAGWDIHVLYAGGKSVLEVYKRTPKITEHEFNALLAVQGGDSFWKKVDSKSFSTGDEKNSKSVSTTAFNCDMLRSDRLIRAKRIGSGVLFVDSDFDARLALKKVEYQQEAAPVSVNGF